MTDTPDTAPLAAEASAEAVPPRPVPAPPKRGIAGGLTRAFIRSPLTPLFLLASIALGLIALLSLPREEEPQISVPMVDVIVAADGLKAPDAIELVTKPLETILKAIDGVEHTYSQTADDRVMATARFKVGTSADDAILRVHEKLRANYSRMPIGLNEPLVIGRGINDVAIVTLTLAPKPEAAGRWSDNALLKLAERLQTEMIKITDLGLTTIVGGRPDQIRVEPDPSRMARYGITLNQVVSKVKMANRSVQIGQLRDKAGMAAAVAGQTLEGVPDVGLLLLTTSDGRPVYVKDVADVVVEARPNEARAWHLVKGKDGELVKVPAVTLSIAKRAGANAVIIAHEVEAQLARVEARLIPEDVQVLVTRNYGESANEKVEELLFHLALAALSIAALVVFAVGWREGVVVLVVVPTTILLTMFASWIMGYTINRVSLFALIFSIGILVDDAIVVVENIDRHWSMNDGRSKVRAAIDAVAEVGNPTIVATLTVVAALLPMMFVSGLMGPYMSPIPANASAAMVFSFFVAVMLTPWLMVKLASKAVAGHGDAGGEAAAHAHGEGGLGKLYRRIAAPIVASRRAAWVFLLAVGIATLVSMLPFYTKHVTVKLLPFDNKSEIQVIVDLPEGASLEATERVLLTAADRLKVIPELEHVQAYAGTAAPFNFNGLVRHYFLRAGGNQGDLQVNLTPKAKRSRQSHAVALEIREKLKSLPMPDGTTVKVVEVPPGPPVLSTLLMEVYGEDSDARRATTRKVREAFARVPFVVDVDDTVRQPAERLRFRLREADLEWHGVSEEAVYDTLQALVGGVPVGYSHRGENVQPIEIVVRLPKSDLSLTERLLSTPVPGARGNVELGDLVEVKREPASHGIFRRDGRVAEMVSAELAGAYEAPIYGMLAVSAELDKVDWGPAGKPEVRLVGQPEDESKPALLWDGEWEVTYVTFRDMGAAFGVAMVGIFLLVVAQFGSFRVPLIVLVPVPLTLVGIVTGHWLFGAPFTATSMIGFIALAGIIVRNSILLIDFIRHSARPGARLVDIVIEAGAIRAKPILLTAIAAMIGAAFILTDPIFQGLAISLLFGLASSTLLTLLVIPAIYIALRGPDGPTSRAVAADDGDLDAEAA
ncbi:MAG: efflux RND transporter permease subunit [Hyphomicrobiaceae bacterium]|nr:efflux RND transporter permease subunit [Hyphomicrobiaceae bacterium]